jgi:hypothetical protein
MQSLFTLCASVYILIYAFEGVIRYELYNVGASSAILARDGLLVIPLAALLIAQACRLRVHPAFFVFGAIVAVHGTIAALNIGLVFPALYGAMLLVNILFGFIAARQLTQPPRRVVQLMVLIWVASIIGVVLDKFVYTMPWTGLETHIGGITVDVSRAWDTTGIDKRVAGFTRSSIATAMLLPAIALVLAPRMRSFLLRVLFLAVTCTAIAFTTQKGSLIAFAVVTAILCMPAWSRYWLLCVACISFAAFDVALPLATSGLLIPEQGGVFSLGSFAMRISTTWPDAWSWIHTHDIFPFGVGLGGIGGAQRFYAQDFTNPSDNLFIYLYGNFGVWGVVYLAWAAWIGRRLPNELRATAIAPLAILAFELGYGAVLSMLEDQMASLFIGAAVGMLWQLHQVAKAGIWSDPYRGAMMRLQPSIEPAFMASSGRALKAR